jgi:hypothetical protein
MSEPVLLRDVIDIPEHVNQGDLVFRLVDAHNQAADVVRKYVVTPQLCDAFLEAVALIRSAVQDRSSKAAYLHGSFGSGKSNFMGMLELLLDGDPQARAIPELAPVVAALDEWKGPQKFLSVPFHLIGADDLESAVFGQYVEYMRETHPDAPPPAVYGDEPLLENAEKIRKRVGDHDFFSTLSEGVSNDSGWGDLAAAWDSESYDRARFAPHGDPERVRLGQALMSTWLSAFADAARANRGGYVNFGDGLAAISSHAAALGYAGVILFLDELILWFLSRLGDTTWVSAEASKLSNLVEAASASRPVPIISIIARQRDLRELVDESVPGAERLSFADQLRYQQGRFGTIHLDDSNLPVVAHKRLLQPVDDAAAEVLRAAFASLSLPATVHDVLLAETGDEASFALTYPFSPAFMTVLVDVAGALQRTRTGLRVLLDLLVARRDVLEVGQLVPVGDLWDVIADSDEPFSDAMRSAFDQARRIYDQSLRPELLDIHGLSATDEATDAFVSDDRLVKTVLLAALVPQSVPFRDLTVARLVALNHGVIASPVPGQEAALVVNKLRQLGARVGALRLGTDVNNPTVSIVLSEVDTGAILAAAEGSDNLASRRTLVRDIVLEALELKSDQLLHSFVWNGIRRDVHIAFGNIRDVTDLPDAVFANDGPEWKVVVDFPFDEAGHAPNEDLDRLEAFRAAGRSWATMCWLPSFFTAETNATLSRLVRLNYVLKNDDRFADASVMLSAVARASAKPQLEAMQREARNQIDTAIAMAYGVISADDRVVDKTHTLADHFPSLRTGFAVRPPTRPNLREALREVLEQALQYSFPAAPVIDGEVRLADVKRIAALCQDAVVEPDGRLRVNDATDRRLLMRVANPLQLGLQSEQAFTLQRPADNWDATFTRAMNAARERGEVDTTVGVLRAALNSPQLRGLTTPIENLIIIVWAQATSHTFEEHGGPANVTVERVSDDWKVVAQVLPDSRAWDEACERLSAVFGVTLPTNQLSGFAVERAGTRLAEVASEYRLGVDRLVERLIEWGAAFDLDDYDRLSTALAAQVLIATLAAAADDVARIDALAASAIRPSQLGLGRSIVSATDIARELEGAQIKIVLAATARPEGAAIREQLVRALSADEFVTPLVEVLREVSRAAVALLAGSTPAPPPSGPATSSSRSVIRASGFVDAREQLDKIEREVGVDAAISVTIEWDAPAS